MPKYKLTFDHKGVEQAITVDYPKETTGGVADEIVLEMAVKHLLKRSKELIKEQTNA